ncbi:MAG: radical SAM protein [Candidatus Thermoplasmatota archaeon]|nr:radical SAM protein [Candidatus Thermoplasmatota archaeon]
MDDREIGDHLSSGIIDLMDRASSILTEYSETRPEWVFELISHQVSAAGRRKKLDDDGVHVPAFMIISVTRECNLNCRGCYARKLHSDVAAEMDDGLLRSVLEQCKELGVSIVLTAGGEPLLRPGLVGILKEFPEIIFPVFTNGLLLNESMIEEIRDARNIVPVLSMEGFEEETDLRRGDGVFRNLRRVIPALSSLGIFWGISVTVTSKNNEVVTGKGFVDELISNGCRLFFYVEYIPIEEETDHIAPTLEQRNDLIRLMSVFKADHPGLFITFPGDEERLGGCLSSGRGFVHVDPSGRLEPCPFAPYSDRNLRDVPLKEALGSELLANIRQNHDMLEGTRGGCTLWKNREWVKGLLDKRG